MAVMYTCYYSYTDLREIYCVSKRFLIILIVIIGAFSGIFFAAKHNSNSANGGANSSAQPTNHVEGENKAGVTLLEYGDFQCPACKAYFPIVEQVVAKHKEDIHYQFRHFPLVQIHQHAFEGARAAESAGKQGKFFEMYRVLYENQSAWSTLSDPVPTFVGYATQLGLNSQQFQSDYSSSAINDIVNADYQEAIKIGAKSTPTFVLNGKRIENNPQSAEEFEKLITDAIAAAKKQ